MPSATTPTQDPAGAWTRLGQRMGRHTATYVGSSVLTLAAGLVSVAVLTRYLLPPEYGRLAVMLVLSSLLSVLYTLGVQQGTYLWTYSHSDGDDEGGGVDLVADADDELAAGADKRVALGTGVMMIALAAVVGTAILVAGAPVFAALFLGDRDASAALMLTAAAGAVGAVWRVVLNIPRMERRPGGFVALGLVRPLLVLGTSIPLVAAGHGANGAMVGILVGTAVSLLIALVVTRRSMVPALSRVHARGIMNRGAPYIVMMASLWALHHADTLVLSSFSSDSQVGVYRVASRVGAFMSYFASAYLMAWGPLSRTSLIRAVKEQSGAMNVNSTFFTYFCILAVWLLLAMTVGADLVVKIAAPSYHEAADILPLITTGFLAYGVFVALYRLAVFPHKRAWYVGWTLIAGITLIGASVVLIPAIGSRGAALATLISSGVGMLGILHRSQSGPTPLPLEYGRLLRAAIAGAACFALARLVAPQTGGAEVPLEIVAVLAYPAVLYMLGGIPTSHIGPLQTITSSMLRAQHDGRRAMIARMRALPPADAALLRALTAERHDPAEEAARQNVSLDDVLARAARATCRLAGLSPPAPARVVEIGSVLYARQAVAQADAAGRRLQSNGVRVGDLEVLEATVRELRRLPPAAWNGDLVSAPGHEGGKNGGATTARARSALLLVPGPVRRGDRAAQHAVALSRKGLDLRIVQAARDVEPGLVIAGVSVQAAVPGRAARLARGPLSRPLLRLAVRSRARRFDPDVVFGLGPSMLPAAAAAARATGARLVYDAGTAPAPGRLVRRRERRLGRGAMVLTGSRLTAERLSREPGSLWTPPVVRTPPGLAPPRAGGRSLRERLHLGDAPLALVVRDGLAPLLPATLVEAVAGVEDLHLVVLGVANRGEADDLRLLAELRLCADRVQVLRAPAADRLGALVAEADVIVLGGSADVELVYRAVGARVPVIAPAATEAGAMVAEHELGWRVPPGDIAGLADAMRYAADREQATAARLVVAADALGTLAAARQLAAVVERALADRVVQAPQPVVMRRRLVVASLRERRLLRRALRHPLAVGAYVRGRMASARGRQADAIGAFERARRRDPSEPRYLPLLAAALNRARRHEEAIGAYREIVAADHGGDRSATVNAAIALARLGATRDARGVLDAASERQLAPVLRAGLAEVQVALGDLAGARETVLAVLDEAPTDRAVLAVAARILDQAGEPTRALEAARDAGVRNRLERLSGVLRTLDADWRPSLPWRPARWPRRRAKMLNLLETSLPHAHAGYSTRTATVLAAQRRAGIVPVAATRLGFPVTRGVRDFAPVDVVDGIEYHRFVLPDVTHYTAIPPDELLQRYAAMLAPLVEAVQPTMIQATTPHYNGLAALALRDAYELPFIYDARGFPEMTWAVRAGGDTTEMYRRRRAAETRCMREADAVITLSDVMRDHIISRGLAPQRVFVVPQAVDVNRLKPARPDPALARRYGVEGRFVIGYLGSLLAYEGLGVLLDALAALRRRRPDAIALIVGEGIERQHLEERARALGLERHVIFAGRVPFSEAAQHYALFDVVVVPRLDHEVARCVTALKPFEIMAMQRCLVVSDVPALAETTDGGRTGRTFAAGSSSDLGRVLLELAEDPAARETYGREARAFVADRHNAEVVADSVAGAVTAARHFFEFGDAAPGIVRGSQPVAN